MMYIFVSLCSGLAINGLPVIDFSTDDNWDIKCDDLAHLIRQAGSTGNNMNELSMQGSTQLAQPSTQGNSYYLYPPSDVNGYYNSQQAAGKQVSSPYAQQQQQASQNSRPPSANTQGGRPMYSRPSTAPSTQRPYATNGQTNRLLSSGGQPQGQYQQPSGYPYQGQYPSPYSNISNAITAVEDESVMVAGGNNANEQSLSIATPNVYNPSNAQQVGTPTQPDLGAYKERAPRELSTLTVDEVCTVLNYLKLAQFTQSFVDKQIDGETLSFVQTVAEVTDFGVTIPSKARLFFQKLQFFQASGVPFDHLNHGNKLTSAVAAAAVPVPAAVNTQPAAKTKLEEGFLVEANYRGRGRWLAGSISRDRADGTYDVHYDNGETEFRVTEDNVRIASNSQPQVRTIIMTNLSFDHSLIRYRLQKIEVGSRVEANFRGKGMWVPGRVRKIREDDDSADGITYDIDYDDGETEWHVPRSCVRGLAVDEKTTWTSASAIATPLGPARKDMAKVVHSFRAGFKVEANYRGRGKWFKGTISRVRQHEDDSNVSVYDVDYDDLGETETRVPAELIRSLEGGKDSTGSQNAQQAAPAHHSPMVSKVRVREGDRVEGNYRGRGRWFKARVKRDRGDGTYDLDYDDGESDLRVPPELIRSLEAEKVSAPPKVRSNTKLEEGDKVEGNYRGRGKFYPGRISRDRGDGTYDIDYDDGEKETRVAEADIRSRETSRASRGTSDSSGQFVEGTRVESNYRGRGKFYPGKISRIRDDGTYDVAYDDGESEMCVPTAWIRSLAAAGANVKVRLFEGSAVEGNYRGKGKWYKGKIVRDRGDGTFDIDYYDGEKEMRVPEDLIRSLEAERTRAAPRRARLEEGAKIEGNYRGKGKWYKGKISRERSDGTFDIAYDDGESETRVPEDLIRLLDDESAGSRGAGRKARIELGVKVEGNYRGRGKWFKGKITKERLDGTFDIAYDDGESEMRVHEDMIRVLDDGGSGKKGRVEEGAKVEGNYRGRGKWYKGKITKERPDGTFDIAYDDGESEMRVDADNIRLIGATGDASAEKNSPNRFEEGSKVEANYRTKGKWFPGKISRDRGDGTFDVAYDDGESETRVSSDKIRLLAGADDNKNKNSVGLYDGAKVEGNYRGRGKWYKGKITRDRGDGTFDIAYDDGESEQRVPADLIRSLEAEKSKARFASGPLQEGGKVEGNYRGRGKWYSGKITKDRGDGTYDLAYDDGETEQRVAVDLIRSRGGSGAHNAHIAILMGNKKQDLSQESENDGYSTDYLPNDKVEANYQGQGSWLKGRIQRVHPNSADTSGGEACGVYDVAYDNGEVEYKVHPRNIKHFVKKSSQSLRRVQYFVGDVVNVKSDDTGTSSPGIITVDRGNDTYDVQMSADMTVRSRISTAKLRLISRDETKPRIANGAAGAPADDKDYDDSKIPQFEFGMVVEGNKNGKGVWVKAVVQRVLSAYRYILAYSDGTVEENVREENIRPAPTTPRGNTNTGATPNAKSPRKPGNSDISNIVPFATASPATTTTPITPIQHPETNEVVLAQPKPMTPVSPVVPSNSAPLPPKSDVTLATPNGPNTPQGKNSSAAEQARLHPGRSITPTPSPG
jgi:hypothetical protein